MKTEGKNAWATPALDFVEMSETADKGDTVSEGQARTQDRTNNS